MAIQYKLANGAWIDCRDQEQAAWMMNNAANYVAGGDVAAELAAGKMVRCGSDWYEYLRDGDVAAAKIAAEKAAKAARTVPQVRAILTCSCCGATGYAGSYPFSTVAGSCDDCV